MKKIRLSDTDLELFDIEISPSDYNFYQKHKDAFRTMWREQGTPFWTRFVITFRSFTVKHGVIKQMNIDSPKFQNLIDQAFIFIHEQFVDGNDKIAKNFIEDVARLAQHQDKLPALDSKSFAKDPFYARDTRELFRHFFGKPDQRSSYLKVYILCPVFLRFGGSVCRCLIRWVDAPIQEDPKDDSYWTKPSESEMDKSSGSFCDETTMCDNCMDDSGTRFFKEKINGDPKGPKFVDAWKRGDPRFVDAQNPLFGPHYNPDDDWREQLTIEKFRSFLQYVKLTYVPENEQCNDCKVLRIQKQKVIHVCQKHKKKKKKSNKQEDLIKDFREVQDKIEEVESMDSISNEEKDKIVKDIIEKKPRVMKAFTEIEEEENHHFLSNKPLPKHIENAKPECNKTSKACCKGTTVTEDFQYGLLQRGDKSCPKNVVAGFKVIKIEDEKNGLYEVNISAASIRSEEEDSTHIEKMKNLLHQRVHNYFILTAEHMKEQIEGLPIRFEWWEGLGFCVAVFNYQEEEKHIVKKWTNFTLKVAGYREKSIKKVMLSLVSYIAKRKRRSSLGWNLEVDDVVACVLPQASVDIEDVSISIQRGFRFEDRLTEEERESLVTHQPNFCFHKVLMGLEEGEASSILTDKGGKDKLKKMFKAVAEYEFYGNEFVSDLMKKIRAEHTNGKTKADIIWDKMVSDPDRFEFFCLIEKEKESSLWKMGLKTVDIRYFMSNKNPVVRICPICKTVGADCLCSLTKTITADAKKLIEISKMEKVKCLDQDIPKMSYREFNSMMMDNDKPKSPSPAPAKENEKKSKNSMKKNKEKERKIELSSLPKRFQEIGVIADKTLVSIPSKQNTELMGKVPITMDNKEDRMAPIPGMMSSLNLILQNGGKEQKITVSLGAYMPEGKLNEVQEKKNQMKLLSAEGHRAIEVEENKDEKKIKKEEKKSKKSGKGKQGGGRSGDSVENEMKQENKKDLESMLLKEIFGAEEALRVTRQMNTQQGKTNKKSDKQENEENIEIVEDVTFTKDKKKTKGKEMKESDKKPAGESKSKKNKKTEAVITDVDIEELITDNSKSFTFNNNNNNNNGEQKAIIEGETIVLSSRPMDDELTHKISLLRASMPNCKVLVVNNDTKSKPPKKSVSEKTKVKDVDGPLFRLRRQTDKKRTTDSDNEKDVTGKAESLKKCANCKKEEPSRKAFKKCQKCKEEGVEDTRYYCSRDCQLDDWKLKHKVEHKTNQLKLKTISS